MMTIKLKLQDRPAPTSRYQTRDGWILVDKKRKLKIEVGDTVMDSDGVHYVVEYMQPPHKCSSQGKVTVKEALEQRDWTNTWYASVVGCEYQYTGDLS